MSSIKRKRKNLITFSFNSVSKLLVPLGSVLTHVLGCPKAFEEGNLGKMSRQSQLERMVYLLLGFAQGWSPLPVTRPGTSLGSVFYPAPRPNSSLLA
jgi:hypothetical protein